MTYSDIFGNDKGFTGKNGKIYKMELLGQRELAKFVAWVRWQPYFHAKDAGLSAKDLEPIRKVCNSGLVEEEVTAGEFDKFPISITSTCVQAQMGTAEGRMKLWKLSLIKSNDDITDDNIEDFIEENVEELLKLTETALEDLGLSSSEDTVKN